MNLKALTEHKKAIFIALAAIALMYLYPDQIEQLFDGIGEVSDALASIIRQLFHLFLYLLAAGLVIAAIIFSYIGITTLYKRFKEGDSAVRLEIGRGIFRWLGLIALFISMDLVPKWITQTWGLGRGWTNTLYCLSILAIIFWYQFKKAPN